MNIARIYSISKQEGKSAETFQRILKVDKDNLEAHFGLGKYYYAQNKFKEAETQFLAVRKTEAEGPDACAAPGDDADSAEQDQRSHSRGPSPRISSSRKTSWR